MTRTIQKSRVAPLRRVLIGAGALLFGIILPASAATAQELSITVASTTSTEQSGLFGYILPLFKAQTGIVVRVVAVGTGQALDIGRRCDADVVFVHDKLAEERFVADGSGFKRHGVMYNDFVIVGPKRDPARIGGRNVIKALRGIAAAKEPFVSRGDRSGTNAAELRYWSDAGVDLAAVRGDWYKDVGQGMGPALNIAAAMDAYILSDRGTWLSFKNRGDLAILVEGDRRLFNQYGATLVNPAKCPNARVKEGRAFIAWLVSANGQRIIGSYKIGGEQLFFPNADSVSAGGEL